MSQGSMALSQLSPLSQSNLRPVLEEGEEEGQRQGAYSKQSQPPPPERCQQEEGEGERQAGGRQSPALQHSCGKFGSPGPEGKAAAQDSAQTQTVAHNSNSNSSSSSSSSSGSNSRESAPNGVALRFSVHSLASANTTDVSFAKALKKIKAKKYKVHGQGLPAKVAGSSFVDCAVLLLRAAHDPSHLLLMQDVTVCSD